jgi:sugar lactone lactonase YvrE
MKNLFKNIYINILFATVLLIGIVVIAADILEPETNIQPTGYTLDDIYDLVVYNVEATAGGHILSTSSSPTATTTHTISEVYTALTNLIERENIRAGITYLGIIGNYGADINRSTTTSPVVATLEPLASIPSPEGYTLEDVWNLISSNATSTEGSYSVMALSSPEPTMHTTTEIYNALANLIDSDNLKAGVTYLGTEGTLSEPTFAYVSQVFGRKVNSLPGELDGPYRIVFDSLGYMYVLDTNNNRVQKFDSSGNYVLTFGSTASGFGSPYAMAIDSSDNIYVAINRGEIQKFDTSGNSLLRFGSYGSGDGQFSTPSSMVVDEAGYIYVTDINVSHRVQIFAPDGTFLSKFGSKGTSTGQFWYPWGIALDASSTLHVLDSYGAQKFATSGEYISRYGTQGNSEGQLSDPRGIDFDSQGNIFVSSNHEVLKYDSDGNYISQFGTSGTSTGQFSFPYGLTIDSSDNIYIADVGNDRVQKFDSTGVYISTVGIQGSEEGQLSSPSGAAIDNLGNIYVVDSGNHTIKKYDSSFNFLLSFGSNGTGELNISGPEDAAIGIDGNIYVTDNGNNRIQVFALDGTHITHFGSAFGASGSGDGQMKNPRGIFIASSTGDIFVADTGNNRIQKFDSSYNFIFKIGTTTSGTSSSQFNFPRDIAVDSLGNIYVLDQGNHRIQKFDSNGNYLLTIGSRTLTGEIGKFNTPNGIAVDNFDNVYVVDRAYARVQVFTPEGLFIYTYGTVGNGDDQFSVPARLYKGENNDFYIGDSGNNRVKKINFDY